MKAAEANFLRFLNKSDQLEVPIYQRTYSWTRSECLQLWNDVVRAAHNDVSGHFIGSIVYIDTGIFHVSTANTIEVIDGQQRLTTISLLLLAVARALETNGARDEKAARKLIKDYLLQDEDLDPGVEGRYKLLLTKSDRDTSCASSTAASSTRPRRRGWSTPSTCSSSNFGGRRSRTTRSWLASASS